MNKHHNYDLIVAAASGEEIEVKDSNGEWVLITNTYAIQRLAITYNTSGEKFRIRVKTIRIGDTLVPEPVRDVDSLKINQEYWTVSTNSSEGTYRAFWTDSSSERQNVANGFVHLTKDAAKQHYHAFRRISQVQG